MVFQKDTGNTLGRIIRITKEISSKDTEMATAFGKMAKNSTKGTICLTKNMDLVYTTGVTGIYIRVILWMRCDLDRGKCFMAKNHFIMDYG
jgi:hypothetical protein